MKESTLNISKEEKEFLNEFQTLQKKGVLPEKLSTILNVFFQEYKKAAATTSVHTVISIFRTLLKLILEQMENPHSFSPYHQKVRAPFDYYAFGMNFLRPLLDLDQCKVLGMNQVANMADAIAKGENVILLANHQSEVDPQIIDMLLQSSYPDFGANIIYVAGERVITDPAAIPFSLGRDLLCIYSKKYIDFPPELKQKKQLHNNRTMKLMSELLGEGGKAIYVAPSGGRDRKNAEGVVEVAPFDPQSVEMFYLMAKKAKKPTHFYPLALWTYDLVPPPDTVQMELGEMRRINRTPVHLAFGKRIDMQHFPGADASDKITLRKNRADYIWNLVKEAYQKLATL